MKNENKILVMLALFSIAIGLWGNFRQLWLQDNQLGVNQISSILSAGTLFCGIGIFIFTKWFNAIKIKKIISICLILKVVNLIILYLCNHTGNSACIKGLSILDIVLEKIIIVNIYPLIITIKKSNTLYSKRKLVEYLFKDVGILVGGITIGKVCFGMMVNYNMVLLISIFFLMLSWIILQNIHTRDVVQKRIQIKEVADYIIKDTLLKSYFLYTIFGKIAMNTGLGLKMLMLTNMLNFSDSQATNYLLIIGLLADLLGILALKYFTPKNDYITVTLKFGIRFLAYIIAFISNNIIIILLAITWSILISTSYENIIEAPYVNHVKNKYQRIFTNIREITAMIAESMGLLIAGITYYFGIQYMLGISAFFMLFQIGVAYYMISIRHKLEMKYYNEKYKENGVILSFYGMQE